MEIILLGSILLLRVVQSITKKYCSTLMPTSFGGVTNYISLQMGLSAAGAVIFLLIGGNVFSAFSEMSATGWLISAATGIAIAISSVCGLLVLKYASVTLGALFSSAGLLVPTIGGIFLYNQPVRFGQWVGICCLFAAAVLLASSSGKTNGKITVTAIVLLLGSMLSNGVTMLLQTLFIARVPQGNISLYAFLQFLIPSVFLWVLSLLVAQKSKEPLPKTGKKLFVHTLFAALALLGISQLATIASAHIPVAILCAISDGGGMVISAVVAAAMFKEKITYKSAAGIVVSIVGLIMIKLL